MKTPDSAKTATKSYRANEEKWGRELMDAGWTALPSVILERQRALGLDAIDINILLHLLKHWWTASNLPHPGKRSIAECMGIQPRSVQRRLARLERDGLIRRIKRRGSDGGGRPNDYDLSGLIDKVRPFAVEKLAMVKERRRQDEAARRRKRPRVPTLRAVPPARD